MATKTQIAERVLQKLMVLEHGETMDTGDQSIVEAAYDSAYALLENDKLVTWGSGDNIPTGAELPVIDYVANRVKGAFQIPPDVRAQLPGEALVAERDLFALTQADYVPDETPAQYY